ncbi:MAG: Gfo/Idh/MocA family oxidoreductase [Chloroflexi bacterium]|nr:Gfo/Idh/MocA family oxidoreductase [Chloroflexota bacterium]
MSSTVSLQATVGRRLRVAFAGFRHGHILDLYRRVLTSEEIEVVAACEEDWGTREQLAAQGHVAITHSDFRAMLASVDCDAVAVGDYYARRGSLALEALRYGKHVISDKPVCTELAELEAIERLTAETGLRMGCMLDMRDAPQFRGLREVVQSGALGEPKAIHFGGQHPLLVGTRPAWYFEVGKHGGTINDIAVHMMDAIPWITGCALDRVLAARCWNARADAYPHFRDAGQMMLTLDNGCGVIGDVSYLVPDSLGYRSSLYWRTTIWGTEGVAESSMVAQAVHVGCAGDDNMEARRLPSADPGGYLRAFLHDVRGQSEADELRTADVLRATRCALVTQAVADEARPFNIEV